MQRLKRLRLNLFDWLIIVCIAAAVGALLWLRMGRTTEWITLRLVVANDEWWYEGSPPQWWYVDDLSAGQAAKNTFGDTVAEIVNVESFDVGAYRRRAYIDIRVRGLYDKKRQVYLYNYQPLQIGKPFELTVGKHNIHGIITYIDKLPVYTDRIIDIRVPAVLPDVARSYHEGLTMKDSVGNVLASVLSVSTYPSSATEVVERGEKTDKKFPGSQYFDVVMRLRIKTFRSGSTDYFVDRAAIKVGEQISFQFPKTITREATIIGIVE